MGRDGFHFWLLLILFVSTLVLVVKICKPRRSPMEMIDYQIECYREFQADYNPTLLQIGLDGYANDDRRVIDAYDVLFKSYLFGGKSDDIEAVERKYLDRLLSCKDTSVVDSLLSDIAEYKEYGYVKSKYKPIEKPRPKTHVDSIVYIANDVRLSVNKRSEILRSLTGSLTKEEAYDVGQAWFDLWIFPEAIKYYKQALDGYTDYIKRIDLCQNIAVSYMWLEKYVYARYYLFKAQWYINKQYGLFNDFEYKPFNQKTSRYFYYIVPGAQTERQCMLYARLYGCGHLFSDYNDYYTYTSAMSNRFDEYSIYAVETSLSRFIGIDNNEERLNILCRNIHYLNKHFYRYFLVSSPYIAYRIANSEADIQDDLY